MFNQCSFYPVIIAFSVGYGFYLLFGVPAQVLRLHFMREEGVTVLSRDHRVILLSPLHPSVTTHPRLPALSVEESAAGVCLSDHSIPGSQLSLSRSQQRECVCRTAPSQDHDPSQAPSSLCRGVSSGSVPVSVGSLCPRITTHPRLPALSVEESAAGVLPCLPAVHYLRR